jgi:hypothetical protein
MEHCDQGKQCKQHRRLAEVKNSGLAVLDRTIVHPEQKLIGLADYKLVENKGRSTFSGAPPVASPVGLANLHWVIASWARSVQSLDRSRQPDWCVTPKHWHRDSEKF